MIERCVLKNLLEFLLLSRSLAWIYASINQNDIALFIYALALYLDLITSYTEYPLSFISHSRCSIEV